VLLVEAEETQKQERDRVTYLEWGPPLTPQGFLAREVRLRAHAWTRAGMRTWLLQEEDGRVLASCETFRTSAFLHGHAGAAHAVASVFTEVPLRGRGYAGQLMARLTERMRQEADRPLALVLFSDVGEPLYARAGYRAVPAFDWTLPPRARRPEHTGVDVLFSESDVAQELAQVTRPTSPLVLWPDAAQLDWHLERERIYAEQLGRPRPLACGARVGGARAFWAGALRTGELVVLLMEAQRPEEARALMRCAQAVAQHAGLSAVRLWEDPRPQPWLPALAEEGGVREAREGSLPMLASLAAGVSAADWWQVPRALWV
jgi:GNAT superfamily N-acetyltransferase